MKKFFMFLMSLALIVGVSACTCTQQKGTSELGAVAEGFTVEQTISLDRQAMFLQHGDVDQYRWYETCVKLTNWLDEENDGAIDMVVNVFQTIEQCSETTFDTYVYKYQHLADGTVNEEAVHGFWVEDYPLNEEAIVITFKEAFQKVQEVNLPKPHTRNVVLRKEIGPIEANPQWIFGNLHEQIYVDAVTGEVSATSPSFKGLNLGTPLGEWP